MKSYLLRALSICALGIATLLPGTVSAEAISKTLTVQVFQLFNDEGNNGASLGPAGDSYYAAEVNKIWAQAGISVSFNYAQAIKSTDFSNIDDSVSGDGFADLAAAYGTHGPSATSVDMFLVHTIVGGAYGEGWVGAGGLVIAMDTVMAYSNSDHPNGRIDTIAHELGHNFGLVPSTDPDYSTTDLFHSTNALQLMAGGGIRDIPSTLADIAPDGNGWDLLSPTQITTARGSTLLHDIVTPEPGAFVVCLSGLGAVGFIAVFRRRKVSRAA